MLDASLDLLCGGFHRCTPAWNKSADVMDRCFKFYFVTGGAALLKMDYGEQTLAAGRAYFIPGPHIAGQRCDGWMDVYWAHAMPSSLHLSYLVSHVSRVHEWRLAGLRAWSPVYRGLERLSEPRTPAFACRLEAMLLALLGDVLALYDFRHVETADPVFERLQPAIRFMDDHFLLNPPLSRIAAVAHLAPTYFHRVFTRTFFTTPHAYMLGKRMNLARQLLQGTSQTVEQVATRAGYENPFYFSRAFKKFTGISPRDIRRQGGP